MGASTPPPLGQSGPGLPLALPWVAGAVVLVASLFGILVNAAINDPAGPPTVLTPSPTSEATDAAASPAAGDTSAGPSPTAGPPSVSPTAPSLDANGDPPGDGARVDGPEPSADPWLVTRVMDGDTFEARRDGTTITVRLAQVDAPAPDACFGAEATAWLTDTILGQQVVLEPSTDGPDTNELGHRLREAWLGESINVASVRLGHATRQPLDASDDADLAGRLSRAQAEAQEEGRGLWSACTRPPPPPNRDDGSQGGG